MTQTNIIQFTNSPFSRKVRYDMRGHGRSDKPTSPDAHTSVRYAQDFSAVSRAFSLDKPVFVGWSVLLLSVQGKIIETRHLRTGASPVRYI